MYIYIHTLYYYKLFLYFNLCLNILLDILSYSFTSTSFISTSCSFTLICIEVSSRLVIGTSRTVGSAKKSVRITSGFGGGEFTKTLARYVHVKNWNFLFYCSYIAKSENAMLWWMLSRLETCIVYSCIWSVTLGKSIVPRKTWRKLWHSYISKLFFTKMQIKFSIFFYHGSLIVIGDKFRFVRSKLKSR